MTALNFSSAGTRWRVLVVDREAASEHIPPLPSPGLLFTAADGERRFLRVAQEPLPTIEDLRHKTNEELGELALRATAWPVESGRA